MKLPFKIVWRDSEEDLREKRREERQEQRLERLETCVKGLIEAANMERGGTPTGRFPMRIPASRVIEGILQHLKLDIHMTPRKEASLALKSTESLAPATDSVSGP